MIDVHALPRLAAAIAAVNTLALAHAQGPALYVDDDAPPGGDGQSWNTAFNDIQDALDAARLLTPPRADIYVAEGTYRPDRGSLDRDDSFALTSAVNLFGGFAGLGAPNPDARDPARFVSVLSGDLRSDDAPGYTNRSDNSYHVIDASHTGGEVTVDGFTIRAGHADGEGVRARGAAVLSDAFSFSGLVLSRCQIIDSYCRSGAAISASNSFIVLADSTISRNWTDGHGAAALDVSSVQALRTRITNNNGAPNSSEACAVLVTNWGEFADCLIDANGVDRTTVVARGHVLELSRCTIANNAVGPSSTLVLDTAFASINGCIIRNASSVVSDTEIIVRSGSASISGSNITGGQGGVRVDGGTLAWTANVDADPLFTGSLGIEVEPADWTIADYSLTPASPGIDTGVPAWQGDTEIDLAGAPRIAAGQGTCRRRADMGALEFQGNSARPAPAVVYVSSKAKHGGDGHSWATALRTITDALNVPGVVEIRVAEGRYTPHDSSRAASFELGCDIRLLGGYSGSTSDPDERDPARYPTILSGDLLDNDDATEPSRADNSYRVMLVVGSRATIDGVIIERAAGPDPFNGGGGSAIEIAGSDVTLLSSIIRDCSPSGPFSGGGAITASYSILAIDSCTFENNEVRVTNYAQGAALRMSGGSLRMTRSRFAHNTVWGGGYAIGGACSINVEGDAVIADCVFENNTAATPSDQNPGIAIGGAAYVSGNRVLITNCAFRDNSVEGANGAIVEGAGLYAAGLQVHVVNSAFSRNRISGEHARGAAAVIGGVDKLLSSCTVFDNRIEAATVAGAAGVHFADPGHGHARIVNSIIWGNTGPVGASLEGQFTSESTDTRVDASCIQGWDGSFPGQGAFDADPHFISSSDLRLAPGSPCVDAASAVLLARDAADLDADGDIHEPLPLDLSRHVRVVGPRPDIGAYETQPATCAADHDHNGTLNTADLFGFLTAFFAGSITADFNADTVVDSRDLFDYLSAFVVGC